MSPHVPRLRRHRRVLLGGAVAAVVVLLLVVADTVVRAQVDHRLTARAACALDGRGVRDVRVTVGGGPALVTLLTRRAERVEVAAVLPFSVLGDRAWSPGDGSGAALGDVSWSAQDGLLVATTELRRRVRTVPLAVALQVDADDGDLLVTPQTVEVAGLRLPADRAAQLLPASSGDLLVPRRVDVQQLLPDPDHDGDGSGWAGALATARLTSVAVQDDGLAFSLVTQDVAAPAASASTAPDRKASSCP
ncbi:hypothetical protein [Cellulomonas fimi]|uniref:Uncharacterized protein n=1 Tax=Cellulomonas fimi (strain ATCC 484 / DSM 20113 / JCM 1341 / CCUG 24087 / LMG 16345 / NBRC 15513 / NCIMB 8980 / NCTC 7547 / NRS-133) TaxID=590998 RepID=F4H5M2_CELFA|nr:hypothetical protein [Cellulomonas fimi]AEE44346.1 hypothetical protein Celf_0200 [Cellulomonas fimi ATCC 484]NNH08129.1 hypothetical protein [Cellulomonas fimi]VEH26171.1 Uncharacterised protein [Cellulomonas fimi]